jgi:hypothetical protein
MRCASVGFRRRAVAGSRRASSACSAGQPRARHQRHAAAREDALHGSDRVGAEAPGRVAPGRIDQVDQVVRHLRALDGRGLGRADVHAAVHQRRVHAHDFRGQARSEPHRQRRLAARGRPEERERDRRH